MNIQSIITYFFGLNIVVWSIYMIVSKNLVRVSFSFVSVLLSIAAIYILLQAEFVAISQILIYVGGILVLMIFGIMLTNQKDEVKKTYSILQIIFVLLFVITIVLLIAKDLVSNLNISAKNVKTESNFNAVETLGIRLLSTEVLPFELSAVLLLVSLLGAAFIATKKYLK